ncbi:hypothetical protein DYBT9275_01350 [Dyadobacter sp. CECT 9275]|uniref:Uncharacterized protein n=1 Tax=Dyadobacter helix TaxID=2822344 RepID=A0A916JB34_9BACT|nr:hypothetical protein [Dyadobacter sp. CECT 9275]CAG4994238.1 hypothetical protein DYBT9275_01350 [Dyadobacter sp. CECT 9275]
MQFRIAFILAIFLIPLSSYSQTDSLIIKGQILNLNGRLYRQASVVTFSRNNILQPQSELSKQAPLQPDGTFRVSLPIFYQQEEFYLDYGGKAFTTFLGSPGEIQITFDGDSLATAKRLFYFSGVNADANNQYYSYLESENKSFTSNKTLGVDFYKTFWDNSPDEALRAAEQRAQLRKSALTQVSAKAILSPALKTWVSSLAEDEKQQNIYEYVLANRLELGTKIADSIQRLNNPPLTAQRATWLARFGSYADAKVEDKKSLSPGRNNSLPVKTMADLFLNNTPNLTEAEREKLTDLKKNGAGEKSDVDFMSRLFGRNEPVLNLLFDFERESRVYRELFDSTALDFLNARYLSNNFYKFSYNQQIALNKHIQTRLKFPQLKKSLAELVSLEVKDSSDIRKFVSFKDVRSYPVEVIPGYWISASNDRGNTWLNDVLQKYIGKTLYLVKWNLEDAKSREDLEYMAGIRAQLPPSVEIIYLHLQDEQELISTDLARQYIVRHNLKGIHMFLNSNQVMDLIFRLNPSEPATYAIIKPNGKFHSKNAPAPNAPEKLIPAILNAEK